MTSGHTDNGGGQHPSKGSHQSSGKSTIKPSLLCLKDILIKIESLASNASLSLFVNKHYVYN